MEPPVNHTRRSWTDNGVHYTVQTARYSSPGVSFSFNGGHASNLFSQPQPSGRGQSTGVLGAAFGLLGDVLAARQQVAVQQNSRRSGRQDHVEGMAYGDNEYPAVEQERTRQPRSFMSTLADRLLNNSQNRSQQAPRNHNHSYQQSGSNRPHDYGRSQSYRMDGQRSSRTPSRSAYVEDYSGDEDDDGLFEGCYIPRQPKPRRVFTANDASMIEALQNAAEHHRREARDYRAQIQAASRQRNVDITFLQNLLDELKAHENAYQNAQQQLEIAREGSGSSTRQQIPRRQSYQQRGAPRTSPWDFEGTLPTGGFDHFHTRRPTHPLFTHFDFEHDSFADPPFDSFPDLFGPFGPGSTFFGMPGAQFTFESGTNGQSNRSRTRTGPQPQRAPAFATAPRAPPTNLLKPEEARRTFKTYNERWNALPPNDPNVPYPARGLNAGALVARDSVWAPSVSSPIETWSDEVVMQANVQAFFLGVVGLTPQYSEAPGTGRVVMGYNKAQANAAQTKELIDILKKEKGRWHSDRLGRRNGGMVGPNEALQCDEKARAAFHGVCELMEVAQGA